MEQDKNPMVEHALRELEIMGIKDNGDDAVVETHVSGSMGLK